MDATAFEDTMEVGSDAGHGHLDNIDDIEIDLEIAEGQIAEQDNDVIVEDASVTASDHPNDFQDIHNDADMLDEEYVDGDITRSGHAESEEHYYQNEDGTVYHTQDTYEAEMEDFEEDIDAPIPDNATEEVNVDVTEHQDQTQTDGLDLSKSAANADNTEVSGSTATSATAHDHVETAAAPTDKPTVPHQEDKKEPASDDHDEHTVEVKPSDSHADQTVRDLTTDDADDKPDESDNKEVYTHDQEGNQPVDEELNNKAAGSTGLTAPENHQDKQHADAQYDAEVYEEEEAGADFEALHPIKVFYQDSEISLFPPKDDDPSETFFLEDESLVHKPVSELLHACRDVLGDHITAEDEVIVDIECLGLQLSEDSTRASPVTLLRILQTYLDLCVNDSVNDPEPLYLTLSSRPTFGSSFSTLVSVAAEGKGLLHVQGWDDYNTEQEDEGELHERQTTEATEFQDKNVSHEEDITKENAERHQVETPQSPSQLERATASGVEQISKIDNQEKNTGLEADEPKVSVGNGNGLEHENVPDSNTSVNHNSDDHNQATRKLNGDSLPAHKTHPESDEASNGLQDQPHVHEQGAVQDAQYIEEGSSDHEFRNEEPSDFVGTHDIDHTLESQAEPKGEAGYDVQEPENVWQSEENEEEERVEEFIDNTDKTEYDNDLNFDIDVESGDQIARQAEQSIEQGHGGKDSENVGDKGLDKSARNATHASDDNSHEHADVLNLTDQTTTHDHKTPEPSNPLLDIDEDLFRSPTTEAYELPKAGNSPITNPQLDESEVQLTHLGEKESPGSYEVPETAHTVNDALEDFENLSEDGAETSNLQEPSEHNGSPKPVKRSRIDDDIHDVETPLPDLKRPRSE